MITLIIPISTYAMIGETPAEIALKMGEPVKTTVRPFTDFPHNTYGLYLTPGGWLSSAAIEAKAREAAKHNRNDELETIQQWMKQSWGVQVVYIDGKSMCASWIPLGRDLAVEDARIIFRAYQGSQQWIQVEDAESQSLGKSFDDDLLGRPGEVSPLYLLKANDGTMFVVYKTHVAVYAKDYTKTIRTARLKGEKKQAAEDEEFMDTLPNVPLALVDWHWKTEHGYAIVEGQVKNISNRKIDDIESVAIFKTVDGTLITSNSSLIEYRPLLPGQTSPFKVFATANPAMETASINFKAMFGSTIPYLTKSQYERANAIKERREQNNRLNPISGSSIKLPEKD